MSAAADLLRRAHEDGDVAGAAWVVGDRDRDLEAGVAGVTAWESGAPVEAATVWDIASLTKPIVAIAALALVERGALRLDDTAGALLADYRGTDKARITVEQLLTHSSGIPGRQPLYRSAPTRAALLEAVRTLPLRFPPGTGVEYTSQGFMVLGEMLIAAGGVELDALVRETVTGPLGMATTVFRPPAAWEPWIAATEDCTWRGRVVKGEVHDENAVVLGGVAGHAGLFSTAADMARLGRAVLRGGELDGHRILAARTMAAMGRSRTDHLGLRRALGWQGRDAVGCPVGTAVSPASYGHTGFTGTSLWIDPEAGRFAVLLTNAVHPRRERQAMRVVRPRFHTAVLGDRRERCAA